MTIRLVNILAALLLAGCAAPTTMQSYAPPIVTHKWFKAEQIQETRMVKIETDLAGEFCNAVLGTHAVACAIRFPNGRCVVVIEPNAGEQASHEAGHCLGYDHK